MRFEIGQKVRVSRHEGNKKTEENFRIKIGSIVAVSRHNIVLQFKNYRESFSIADFQKYKIETKSNKKWVQLKIK